MAELRRVKVTFPRDRSRAWTVRYVIKDGAGTNVGVATGTVLAQVVKAAEDKARRDTASQK